MLVPWRVCFSEMGWFKLNHPPSRKSFGAPRRSLSEGFNLNKGAPRSDIAEFGVGSEKIGEKKTPTKREKGKSLKLTVIYMFFSIKCGDTCVFWV